MVLRYLRRTPMAVQRTTRNPAGGVDVIDQATHYPRHRAEPRPTKGLSPRRTNGPHLIHELVLPDGAARHLVVGRGSVRCRG
jgi:hypothetical protein